MPGQAPNPLPTMPDTQNYVAEMQGLYGPFTVAERVVQKIWRQLDFDFHRAVLTDGRRLEVLAPGKWNLLGGSDFQGARLRVGGADVLGDIEVHFHSRDWDAHGHQQDPAYANVVLHVVLFPPDERERSAKSADGRELATLVLLPLLNRDLEEYASDDALEIITARAAWRRFAALGDLPLSERLAVLQRHAGMRWHQKVRSARLRLEKIGWREAAHQTALEILGYRFNRAVMLGIATHYPADAWARGVATRELHEAYRVLWQLQGVRPANHPRLRLQQYESWTAQRPDWPTHLLAFGEELPVGFSAGTATGEIRAAAGLAKWRDRFANEITAGTIGGTRLDNLVCDGFLPLLAAHTGRDLFGAWFHWFAGDLPDQVRSALPKLGVTGGRTQPLCHGYGQGLLGWIFVHDPDASR